MERRLCRVVSPICRLRWTVSRNGQRKTADTQDCSPCSSIAPRLCSSQLPSPTKGSMKERALVSRVWLHLVRGVGTAKPQEWNVISSQLRREPHYSFYIWIVNKTRAQATASHRAFLSGKIRILNVCAEVLMRGSWCEDEKLPFKWSTLQIDECSAKGSAYYHQGSK